MACTDRGKKSRFDDNGTLGILYSAYKSELIDFKEFEDALREIAHRDDIWISEDLCTKVLDAASASKNSSAG